MSDEMARKRKKRLCVRISALPAVCITAVVLALALLFPILPKRAFSENENRTLTGRPEISAKVLLDGSFQENFEDYLADQFPFRDRFFSLSVRAQRLTGKKEINGVFYIKDAHGLRLIDVYEKPENTRKLIGALERLSDGLDAARVTFFPVPTAVMLYSDRLPGHAEVRMPVLQRDVLAELTGEQARWQTVTGIAETLEEGREAGEEVFYRTDHHWTTRGALRGYLTLAGALGLPTDREKSGRLAAVTDSFYGTTWSKVCDPDIAADTIELYEDPAWKGSLTVRFEDTGEETDTPYNREYLEKKDKYSVFLNNLHPLVTIENPLADNARTESGRSGRRALAVVKDSYANCLIPFLIGHYETIYVFDPRYYRGGISDFVNAHPEVEDVLVLYNLGTVDNDRGVGAID